MRHLPLALTLALSASIAASASAAVVRAPLAHPAAAASSSGVIDSKLKIGLIGSAIDPLTGDSNPYGLTIAPASGGLVQAGDLVFCDFNDSFNIQGLGTSIDAISTTFDSKPVHLIADPRLTGCAAIAMGGSAPWVAALDANDNPIVSGAGTFVTAINNYAWTGPWGQVFVSGPHSHAAFYESNANDGSIVRINLGANFSFDKIATGFPVNHGVPGSILAPSGLTYDAQRDVLYVVDGAVNAVIAIHNPANIKPGGITVTGGVIGGPFASHVSMLYAGAPLNAPISAALLFNGDLVVGNTRDNELIEISPSGQVVGSRVLDAGLPGALFGLAAAGTTAANTIIYFNDDDDNTIKALY